MRHGPQLLAEIIVAFREAETRLPEHFSLLVLPEGLEVVGTKAIYKKLYGFVLGEDFAPFDLVLDTDNLDAEEVFEVLCRVIDNVVLSIPKV